MYCICERERRNNVKILYLFCFFDFLPLCPFLCLFRALFGWKGIRLNVVENDGSSMRLIMCIFVCGGCDNMLSEKERIDTANEVMENSC